MRDSEFVCSGPERCGSYEQLDPGGHWCRYCEGPARCVLCGWCGECKRSVDPPAVVMRLREGRARSDVERILARSVSDLSAMFGRWGHPFMVLLLVPWSVLVGI